MACWWGRLVSVWRFPRRRLKANWTSLSLIMHVYHFVEDQCFWAFLPRWQAVFSRCLSWFTFPLMHRTDIGDLVVTVINQLIGISVADIIISFLDTNITSCLHCVYDNNPSIPVHVRVAAALQYLNSKSWRVVLTLFSLECRAGPPLYSQQFSVISKFIISVYSTLLLYYSTLSDCLFDPAALRRPVSPVRNHNISIFNLGELILPLNETWRMHSAEWEESKEEHFYLNSWHFVPNFYSTYFNLLTKTSWQWRLTGQLLNELRVDKNKCKYSSGSPWARSRCFFNFPLPWVLPLRFCTTHE